MKSLNLILLSVIFSGCAGMKPQATDEDLRLAKQAPYWKIPECVVVYKYVGETREQAAERAAILMATEPSEPEIQHLLRRIAEIEREKRRLMELNK
jgi:hypothetical protein